MVVLSQGTTHYPPEVVASNLIRDIYWCVRLVCQQPAVTTLLDYHYALVYVLFCFTLKLYYISFCDQSLLVATVNLYIFLVSSFSHSPLNVYSPTFTYVRIT